MAEEQQEQQEQPKQKSNTPIIVVFLAALMALLIGVAALALFLILRDDPGNPSGGTEATPVGPTPAITMEITLAPTAETGIPTAVVVAPEGAFIRTGPGTNYPPIGTAPFGARGVVVGVSADGGWWVVSVPGTAGGQGWVSAQVVAVQNVEDVPVVPPPPTPTPPATATATSTPVPQVIFTADPTIITAGEKSLLTWSVQNVQAVYLYPVGANWPDFPVEGQGSVEVQPFITTTYELRVIKTDGVTEVWQQEITVNSGLTSGTWLLKSYDSGAGTMVTTLSGTEVTAKFNSDGSLEGSGGCNTYSGTFTAYADVLRVGSISATRTSCDEPEGIMEQEAAYLAALGSAANFTILGNELKVLNSNGTAVVIYNR
jgi:heat shock protein HslJ